MKYCEKCGTQLADNATFCEECGAKQESVNQTQAAPITQNIRQDTIPSYTAGTKKKSNIKKIIIVLLLIVGIAFVIKTCSSTSDSPEDVAETFAEAMMIDFDAKDAVSLMSDKLINYYMDNYGISSEKEIVKALKEPFKVRKEDALGYYGDDWKAKVTDVVTEREDEKEAIVVVSINNTGSDALWHTNIDEIRIYLVNESGKWRVYEFEA